MSSYHWSREPKEYLYRNSWKEIENLTQKWERNAAKIVKKRWRVQTMKGTKKDAWKEEGLQRERKDCVVYVTNGDELSKIMKRSAKESQ